MRKTKKHIGLFHPSSFRLHPYSSYPAWIRTRTNRTKIYCATVTPPGNRYLRRATQKPTDGESVGFAIFDVQPFAERIAPGGPARFKPRSALVRLPFQATRPDLSANAPSVGVARHMLFMAGWKSSLPRNPKSE